MHTTTSVRDRIRAVEHDVARRPAARRRVPGGSAVLGDAYRGSHEHTRVTVADPAPPADTAADQSYT